MNTKQVEYDDLIYTDAHLFFFEGAPFTGVAESKYANGNVRCRFRFKNGGQHGEAEEYFPSGSWRKLTPFVDGAAHGHATEWHKNGVVKIERDIEFGIMTREKEFDEFGSLVKEYIRPVDDSMMQIINQRRREVD